MILMTLDLNVLLFEGRFGNALAWRLHQWDTEQRKEFAELMKQAWKRLGEINPGYIEQQKEFMRSKENETWKVPWEKK